MMITYNHENYIGQAIESVLKQQFNKKFEIVIGVDKSNDCTLEICRQYELNYASSIKLIVHDSNVGMYQNLVSAFRACKGKYIAILEGDDYWSEPQKLQMQYEFFEKNPGCVLIGGLCSILKGEKESFTTPFLSGLAKGKVFWKRDIIYSNRFTTLSTAFRADAINWYEVEKLSSSPHLDWGLYLSLNYGKQSFAYRFNKRLGTYRMHEGGVYSLVGQEKRDINFLKTVYAISTLQMTDDERKYLRTLFTNYSIRLKSIEFITASSMYSQFYDEALIIYSSNNRLKKEFVQSLYHQLFAKTRNKGEFVLSNFELIRQTKRSKFIYTNVFMIPFFLMAGILKLTETVRKQNAVR